MNSESKSEPAILSFVRTMIHSISALELLLYLRAEPQRHFSEAQLVRALRSSPVAVGQALVQLTRHGLVVGDAASGYRYQQNSPELDVLCQQLEIEYARRPVTVIGAILESPNDKLRIFADAFRLAGKKE